jgi:phosphotransferase system  glucose/maltose/N-acetylglucosamine-specific IIC component
MQQIIDNFLAYISLELIIAYIVGMALIIIVPTIFYYWFLKPKIDKSRAEKPNPPFGGKVYKLNKK